jgi:hypothetical protein
MKTALRNQLAFRLTGLTTAAGVTRPAKFAPALMARLSNLRELRYDFPVVLVADPKGDEFALPLKTIVDRLVERLGAGGADAERFRNDIHAVEREIRVLVSQGQQAGLVKLWDTAANWLRATANETFVANVARARAALDIDGELVDCGKDFPSRFIAHAWRTEQRRKTERFHTEVDRLVVGLGEILDAHAARSLLARSPERLRESMGNAYRDAFDFDALARIVQRTPAPTLSESRARRVHALLAALESQRFFVDVSGYRFEFHRCGAALKAFRARLPLVVELARSVAMARLEVDGRYIESEHDPLFQRFTASSLGRAELAEFPDYLVHVGDGDFDALEQGDLATLLCMGAPVKVLVQSDDLLAEVLESPSLATVGARSRGLSGMAMGVGGVFIVQASASVLPALAERVLDAVSYAGPALLSVYSGDGGESSLPPYLSAAAASESRAFPTLVFDPSRESETTSGLSIDSNAQADRAWPVHSLDYEDADHQRRSLELAFTVADYLATDARLSRFFMDVPGGEGVAPVAEWLDGADALGSSPGIKMVDGRGLLHDLVIGDPVIGQTRRARDRWLRLQRLARGPASDQAAVVVQEEAVPEVAAPPAVATPAPEAPKTASSDDAYVETPRCTSCEECMQVNNRLFGYDANKQAFIANIDAGTYRDLVTAAENCQVSIIHPGKPRNPDEPGLAELLERATPFL